MEVRIMKICKNLGPTQHPSRSVPTIPVKSECFDCYITYSTYVAHIWTPLTAKNLPRKRLLVEKVAAFNVPCDWLTFLEITRSALQIYFLKFLTYIVRIIRT